MYTEVKVIVTIWIYCIYKVQRYNSTTRDKLAAEFR